jgi:gp16 family phage-associated protein
MSTPSAFQVRAALLEHGYTITAWAKARGYSHITVTKVIARWTEPRPRRIPHGMVTRAILADLTRDLGMTIVEGIAPSAPPTDDQDAA